MIEGFQLIIKKYNAGEPMVAIELFIVNSSTKMKFINQILFFNN